MKIGFKGKRKIFVNGFYRQWHLLSNDKKLKEKSNNILEMNLRYEKQTELWEKLISDNPGNEIWIGGDFNFDAKSMEKEENDKSEYEKKFNKLYKLTNEKLIQNGMKLMNSEPTRISMNKGKVLDQIYLNRRDKMYNIVQNDFTKSDHSLLEYNRHMKIEPREEKMKETREWAKIDYDIINENIKSDPFYLTALQETDSNKIADFMISRINHELNKQSELRRIKIRKNEENKYSEYTLDLIKEKNILYKKVKRDKLPEDKQVLKNMINKIDKLKRIEIKEKNKQEFEKCNGNSKYQWKLAKEKLYGSNPTHPERIIENNKLIRGSKKVAGVFNRFYISKIRKILQNLDKPTKDPMISYRHFIKRPKEELNFSKITMSQLRKKMKKVKKSNSVSYDKISVNTLVRLQDSIYPLLLQLINTVNETSCFPEQLKIARIFPIRKSVQESALDCQNWRPINLISPISKIIEKFWVEEILGHLIKNKMIDSNY